MGGSRISGKGVHIYKGVGIASVYPEKMKLFRLTETKFHWIFKNGGGGGGGGGPPLGAHSLWRHV